MEETLRAEVECLRKVLAEKDKEIERLHYLLDLYDKEREEQEEKTNGVVWTNFKQDKSYD
jgi:hypothetical protein